MKSPQRFCFSPSRRRGLGFSVVEVLVSLGVVAIGLIQATPSMYGLIIKNQLTFTSNSLVAGLNQARSSAITLGRNITICPSADSSSCTEDAWVSGWIVFNDINENGEADEGEIIRASVQENNLSMEGYGQSVVFRPNGTTNMMADVTISGCYQKSPTASVCSDVSVGAYGKVRSKLRASS